MIKKDLLTSYIDGIRDSKGETYTDIFKFFLPELITAFVLYSALYLLDAHWVASLKSTSTYATLGVTNGIIHFLVKIAEGISVGAIILCGQYNGANDFEKVGRTLVETFWVTCIVGLIISLSLFFGAHSIYLMLGIPPKMVALGIPFLKLRAIGILFTFIYFSFVAFLRSIKNTRTPMIIFLLGAITFIFFDYALIFGKFGFPQMKLNGSALATIIQYLVMLSLAIGTVLFDRDNRKYGIKLFSVISDFGNIKKLLILSFPVVIDKAVMAASYIWLGKMIAPMGKIAIASFSVIKDFERVAFLPAIAFAQVITFLISNDFGALNFDGIKSNIKKVLLLSSLLVFLFLSIIISKLEFFIQLFDKKGAFTSYSAKIFPIISIFLFIDLIQLILSGALRGIGEVKLVMWTRFFVCLGCFFPLSYIVSGLPIANDVMKFILIYGMFYIGNGIMSIIYINKFRSFTWKKDINTKN